MKYKSVEVRDTTPEVTDWQNLCCEFHLLWLADLHKTKFCSTIFMTNCNNTDLKNSISNWQTYVWIMAQLKQIKKKLFVSCLSQLYTFLSK